jgi:small-conductance mechanosensitive channel
MVQFLRDTLGLDYAERLAPLINVAWILLVGYLTIRLIDSALFRLQRIFPASDVIAVARMEQRTETLRHIVRSVCKVILFVIVVLTVTAGLGFDIRPLLASAGIAGLAIGFGAQSLVKDVISGFFILFEDQYGVGDVVKIGELSGVVERMTLRVTVLRNLEGQVHIVPNGNIQTVTVMTKEWARAVLDITVPHRQELALVFEVLQRVGTRLAQDLPDRVLEQPIVLGVEKLDDFGVTIRSMVKTPPFKQADVIREWRRRVKDEFDRTGIEFSQRWERPPMAELKMGS